MAGGTAAEVEKFLDFEPGTFDHIPHYARWEALSALLRVREMGENHVFRPGLYYAVLSDLCRSTEASVVLGNDISKKRVETFILTCVDALGHIDTTNYHLFLREIGGRSSSSLSFWFEDAYEWWRTMHSWLDGRDGMWTMELDLSRSSLSSFVLRPRPLFTPGKLLTLGQTSPCQPQSTKCSRLRRSLKPMSWALLSTLSCVHVPYCGLLKLHPRFRCKVTLPGDKDPLGVYLVDNYEKVLRAKKLAITANYW